MLKESVMRSVSGFLGTVALPGSPGDLAPRVAWPMKSEDQTGGSLPWSVSLPWSD